MTLCLKHGGLHMDCDWMLMKKLLKILVTLIHRQGKASLFV